MFVPFKIILSGICALNNQQKDIKIEGREEISFENFLGGQNSKNVDLGKVLGIGGEGVVIQQELDITVMEGTTRLKSKEKKIVAIKFVNFEKEDGEDFQGHGLNWRILVQNSKLK